ncbi:MAG: SRPBCC family protein, partial [Gemmatimonadota bacterium]
QVADDVLAERVRSKMGRHVSHPGAIEVTARWGRVTLRGPILAHELEDLLSAVASVRGVRDIDDRLEVHRDPGDVPGLQGAPRRSGETAEFRQENWSPAARFAAGTTGGALVLLGMGRLGKLGIASTAVGAGLVARSVANKPVRRLTGIGAGRRAVDYRKTITVQAPLDEVYDFWSRVENFPRIMSHIREVRDIGRNRTRWTAVGPAGIPVSWDAVVTARVPGEVLAWRSEPGSTIDNAGIVRFEPVDGGAEATRIDIRLSYNPPAGAVGDVVASLLGVDPKSAMDEDLVRFKSLIEEGRTRAGMEKVTREDLTTEPQHKLHEEAMKTPLKRYHVMPEGQEWVVRLEESMVDEVRTPNREEAIERGEDKARAEQAELVIHEQDGGIEEERAFV